ncbi:hypothetical protein ACHAAC_17105 [Aeromicrobium sp. CF4.19]|uniref:hypothetical protein n=1 Tax=Aeromicrobium sp. CF4.19 TaxID=3373082 RepID=UPI003EE7DD8D
MRNRTGNYANDLFDFMPATGVAHVILPNMATACGIDFLTMRDQGDSSIYNAQTRWHEVSCPWCHSLGLGAVAHMGAQMQGRLAAAID